MTQTEHDWLPETALTRPVLVAPVAAILDDWSATWLTRGKLTAPFEWRKQDHSGIPPNEDSQRVLFHITPNPRTNHLLAGAMLDRSVDTLDIRTAADRALVEELVQTAMDDLTKRLGTVLPAAKEPRVPNDGQRQKRGWSLPVSLDGKSELFAIETHPPVLISLAKRSAGSPRQRHGLARRSDVTADQTVAIKPVIGRSLVALPDLAKLGLGDVIMLETNTDETLDVRVGPEVLARKAASISLASEHFEMRIERPVDEW